MVLTDRIMVNIQVKTTLKEVILAYFNVISQFLLGWTEKNHKRTAAYVVHF
jgi:hypothetical protein